MPQAPPHLVQYQGSKRRLASRILAFLPAKINRLVEPFCGTAALSISAAWHNRAAAFHLNDLNEPLVDMLRAAIENPEKLIRDYGNLWREQFAQGDDTCRHFYQIREQFNAGMRKPELLLYLLARCVKGSVRYGKNGNFNQSPDRRRHGANPQKMTVNIRAISRLLHGRTVFTALHYQEVISLLRPGDTVYMDPPYQGVCGPGDRRYCSGISPGDFFQAVERLNNLGVDYVISYDGRCGTRTYGPDLPDYLMCKKILVSCGISSQGILLGKRESSYEALYISSGLYSKIAPKFLGQK